MGIAPGPKPALPPKPPVTERRIAAAASAPAPSDSAEFEFLVGDRKFVVPAAVVKDHHVRAHPTGASDPRDPAYVAPETPSTNSGALNNIPDETRDALSDLRQALEPEPARMVDMQLVARLAPVDSRNGIFVSHFERAFVAMGLGWNLEETLLKSRPDLTGNEQQRFQSSIKTRFEQARATEDRVSETLAYNFRSERSEEVDVRGQKESRALVQRVLQRYSMSEAELERMVEQPVTVDLSTTERQAQFISLLSEMPTWKFYTSRSALRAILPVILEESRAQKFDWTRALLISTREGGNRQFAIGQDGEIGPFQFMHYNWNIYSDGKIQVPSSYSPWADPVRDEPFWQLRNQVHYGIRHLKFNELGMLAEAKETNASRALTITQMDALHAIAENRGTSQGILAVHRLLANHADEVEVPPGGKKRQVTITLMSDIARLRSELAVAIRLFEEGKAPTAAPAIAARSASKPTKPAVTTAAAAARTKPKEKQSGGLAGYFNDRVARSWALISGAGKKKK
ncbi:MAG: hypothetical protein K1X83_11805 [Oligoflexia bacterium]|nr:hypothetical protein [Oligoflexia bacterium]